MSNFSSQIARGKSIFITTLLTLIIVGFFQNQQVYALRASMVDYDAIEKSFIDNDRKGHYQIKSISPRFINWEIIQSRDDSENYAIQAIEKASRICYLLYGELEYWEYETLRPIYRYNDNSYTYKQSAGCSAYYTYPDYEGRIWVSAENTTTNHGKIYRAQVGNIANSDISVDTPDIVNNGMWYLGNNQIYMRHYEYMWSTARNDEYYYDGTTWTQITLPISSYGNTGCTYYFDMNPNDKTLYYLVYNVHSKVLYGYKFNTSTKTFDKYIETSVPVGNNTYVHFLLNPKDVNHPMYVGGSGFYKYNGSNWVMVDSNIIISTASDLVYSYSGYLYLDYGGKFYIGVEDFPKQGQITFYAEDQKEYLANITNINTSSGGDLTPILTELENIKKEQALIKESAATVFIAIKDSPINRVIMGEYTGTQPGLTITHQNGYTTFAGEFDESTTTSTFKLDLVSANGTGNRTVIFYLIDPPQSTSPATVSFIKGV